MHETISPKPGMRLSLAMTVGLLFGLLLAAKPASATDPLGTVSASAVTCATVKADQGVPGGYCYKAEVSCPGISEIPVAIKVNEPRGSSLGTVMFTVGGGGYPWYDVRFKYGTLAVQDVLTAGYTTVQFNFAYPPLGHDNSPPTGWLTGPGGPRELACRWATLAQWTHDHVRKPATAFCATGNSAGAAAAGYAIAHYGMASEFNMLEETSGPPFSRIDQGCLCNAPPVKTSCVHPLISECYLGEAKQYLDPAYENKACSAAEKGHRSPFEAEFLHDSLDSADAIFNFPNTDIHFVFGGLDDSSGVAEGFTWISLIQGKTKPRVDCVADAPHEIPDVLDGATKIADDLIAFCH